MKIEIMREIKNFAQHIPGYVLFALAMKEINLIKTQKIALALILLYPLMVIGTLGLAFSGNTGIDNADVAFFMPSDIKGFDANAFISKIGQNKNIRLIQYNSQSEVENAIRQRKAKLGLVVHEPEPTDRRYVVDLLSDNSNIVASEFFFQLAYNSIRRVGFDTSREALHTAWQNLNRIQGDLKIEIDRVDGFLKKLDESEAQLEDLNKSVAEIDIAEMREKLNGQEDFIAEMNTKIDSLNTKIRSFNNLGDSQLTSIDDSRKKISGYRDTLKANRQQLSEMRTSLEQYKEIFSDDPRALAAYNQLASTESSIARAESDLGQMDSKLAEMETDVKKVKADLAETIIELEEIRESANKSTSDLNYFNDELSNLGATVDKVNALISESLETKKKVQSDLGESRRLMDGFVEKLGELQSLSPEFLSNPIIINKIRVYNASKLEIMTPVALVLVLLLTTILLTGVSFITERNEGAYSRLLLSTTGKLEIFAGKMLGQLIFVVAEATIILAIATYGFGVKMAAQIPELLAAICIISVSFITLGLFISNYTRIQSTTILAGLLVVIPMIFISGIIIPVELMSPEVQMLGAEQPLSLGALVITELLIKGTPLQAMWLELSKLAASSIFFLWFTLMNRNM